VVDVLFSTKVDFQLKLSCKSKSILLPLDEEKRGKIMATAYVLYNKKAGEGNALESVKMLEIIINDEMKFIDVSEVSDYNTFLTGLEKNDYIILAGGDGTINCFINNVENIEFDNEVLYFPNGTGNDFAYDLGYLKECTPFSIKKYIRNLPTVTVKGKTFRFINGIGYGIDGYCCEAGDELKKISNKKVNYTAVAINGLLFNYKPTNAKVTVDGKVYTYEKVWLAPTMNGRFYGGGMMPTPNQERNSGKLSTMIFHNAGKIKTLVFFPSIFKGKHIKYKKQIEILTGNEITVEFDRPIALQIDGETISEVSSYTAAMHNVNIMSNDIDNHGSWYYLHYIKEGLFTKLERYCKVCREHNVKCPTCNVTECKNKLGCMGIDEFKIFVHVTNPTVVGPLDQKTYPLYLPLGIQNPFARGLRDIPKSFESKQNAISYKDSDNHLCALTTIVGEGSDDDSALISSEILRNSNIYDLLMDYGCLISKDINISSIMEEEILQSPCFDPMQSEHIAHCKDVKVVSLDNFINSL